MNDREIRVSQLATRMRDFGTAHASDFVAASLGGQKFAELNTLVASIDQFGSEQALSRGSAQTSTGAKRELRALVRSLMKAIRDTAIALESEYPGISNSFRMPPTNGDEALINYAGALPSMWVQDQAQVSAASGSNMNGKRKIKTVTYRCSDCGYLDSYAR